MSVFAGPLAQARSKAQFIPGGYRDEYGVWHDGPHKAEFLAALDLIEQRATGMEKALERIASGETVVGIPGVLDQTFSGRTAQEYKRIARAGLSAREEGTAEAMKRAIQEKTERLGFGPCEAVGASGEEGAPAREEQTRPTPADNRGASSPPSAREEAQT